MKFNSYYLCAAGCALIFGAFLAAVNIPGIVLSGLVGAAFFHEGYKEENK